MSEIGESIGGNTSLQASRPAVGIPGESDSNSISGAILRAEQAGHDVLFAVTHRTDQEAIAFAEELGAAIIELQNSRTLETNLKDALAVTARQNGYPGLIYQSDPTTRVAYDQSRDTLLEREEYAIDAIESGNVRAEPNVLAAIPAYNEASSIQGVVERALEHTDEVLVIDDGSDDATAQLAKEAGATVLEHETNQGYGIALKTAFEEANRCGTEHLVILDGDGQHDVSDISKLVDTQIVTDAEIVIGCRFGPDTDTDLPLYRRVGLGVVNALTNLSMGVVRADSRVRDTQCGFRVYDRTAIRSLARDSDIGSHMGASTDILHHAHANDYDIEEVQTTVDYDVEDASTHSPVAHGFTLVKNLLQTIEHQRPMTALGAPGFLSTFFGFGFGYWTIANYIQTTTFPMGLALTSVFFALAGIFACFTAIILHSLNHHL